MELFKCLVLFLSQNSIIKTIIGTCIPKKHAPQKEHVSAKRAGLFCTFISFFFFLACPGILELLCLPSIGLKGIGSS